MNKVNKNICRAEEIRPQISECYIHLQLVPDKLAQEAKLRTSVPEGRASNLMTGTPTV
jgi:hypothetical protein